MLDRYLARMNESGLVSRIRFREMPPRVEVELTEAGRELLPIIAALSEWGLRWAWTEPREGELLDPAALLRSLPSLLGRPVRAPDGAVELVLDERGGRKSYLAEIAAGGVEMWRGAPDRIAPERTCADRGRLARVGGRARPGGGPRRAEALGPQLPGADDCSARSRGPLAQASATRARRRLRATARRPRRPPARRPPRAAS